MPEGGELISPADFDRWLTPAQAVERLSFPMNDRLHWILRRLSIGHIKAWARKPTFGSVPRELWNEPWQLAERPFWLTGDAEFSALDPYEISHQVVHYLDVRFDPADFPSPPAPPPSVPAPPKGGRPAAAWWPAFAAELAVYVHEQGIPPGDATEGQEAVIDAILQRLSDRGIEPGRTTIQPVIRDVLRRLRSTGN